MAMHIHVQQRPDDQRTAPRRDVSLLIGTNAGQSVRLVNLSNTGLLVKDADHLSVDDLIDVTLAQGEVRSARIVWKNDGFIGANFLQPISQSSLSAATLKGQIGKYDVDEDEDEAGDQPVFDPSLDTNTGLAVDLPVLDKLPMATRVAVILGLTALLWMLVISIALVATGAW